MYSARMPVARMAQLAPPSSVRQAPPQEIPTSTRRESRGSTQMEWMPGKSYPPPNQYLRSGTSQSGRFSSQDSPPSADLNNPPGRVPHQSTPGSSAPPGDRAQIFSTRQGITLPFASRSSTSSGLGG